MGTNSNEDTDKVLNSLSLVGIGIVIGIIYGVVLCGMNCESQA